MTSYSSRAAVVILLWTELLDDTPRAEDCRRVEDFRARRDVFRRELRRWLERRRIMDAPEKWVQRMFFTNPPRKGTLDLTWKEALIEWVASLGLSREAVGDLEAAVRSLFADGESAWTELAARRPGVVERVTTLLEPAPVPSQTLPPLIPAQVMLQDAWAPMYMTDANLERVPWANRAFLSLVGLAADRVRGIRLDDLRRFVAQMIPPEELPNFNERQDQVLEAGRVVGRGFISTTVDTHLRPWTVGLETPPWNGRYRVEIYAHFVLDPVTGERLGSLVVWFPTRL